MKTSDLKVGNENAKTWWNEHRKKYKEANPFRKNNKAGKVEWAAIYNAFDITVNSHKKLVDLGSGTGRFALHFLKKGFDVTGIDISSEAVEMLKKRAHRYKLSKKLQARQHGLNSPIKELEGKFDAGYMIVTYHCISNDPKEQQKVFKNFIKLIRKKGKVLIMEPNPLNPLFYISYLFVYKGNLREGYNIINSRKEILVDLLKKEGMDDIRIYHHSFLPTYFINYWNFVGQLNKFLCNIPIIKNLSAFHIITAVKK